MDDKKLFGFVCHKCGNTDFNVDHTGHQGGRIIRYRACASCGARIITAEKIIICRSCNGQRFEVNRTKRINNQIMRYKSCCYCGRTYSTLEKVIEYK